MSYLLQFYLLIDPLLIFFFRIPKIPILGFYLGNGVLSLICVLLGEITMVLIYRYNKSYFDQLNQEMLQNHTLSIKAILFKSKEHYKAANTLANEAFGKTFFASLALFASSLWPIPFALGWLSFRFNEVTFPLWPTSFELGYVGVFIPIYILIRMLLGKVKKKISWLQIGDSSLEEEEILSWQDLHKKSEEK
ncbi:MAG: hypothetical protein PWR24_1329 [Desulfonauticus sp.]|jgi:hypothetical protein|nr:MAG: hypothetical protein XD41_0596 [Desulfonauticus sp. 38_4375]MDK2921772.1 hypothetical protein [Desulfonauticus sp.]